MDSETLNKLKKLHKDLGELLESEETELESWYIAIEYLCLKAFALRPVIVNSRLSLFR